MAAEPDLVTLGTTALSGGVAGALLTQAAQWGIRFYNRPILRLVFDPTEPGCVVETGNLPAPLQVQDRFIRLKVLNTGRSAADNVTVSVIRLSFSGLGQPGTLHFREEVLELQQALTAAFPIRIPAGGHRFMDVFFTHVDSGQTQIGFSFRANPIRFHALGFGAGNYSAELIASADDAKSCRAEIRWQWDGTFRGLSITGFGYMF